MNFEDEDYSYLDDEVEETDLDLELLNSIENISKSEMNKIIKEIDSEVDTKEEEENLDDNFKF